MVKDLFCRYIWIIDTIYRAGKITLNELNERWLASAQSDGRTMPRRTFINSCEAIAEIFDIEIACERKNGYHYYIKNVDDVVYDGARKWAISLLTVNNIINESRQLRSRILFEEIPSGQKHLLPIINAMRENNVIKLIYQSFNADEPKAYTLHPYCVKVFRQRWYAIGHCRERDTIRTFSLDRIHSLSTTDLHFDYPEGFEPNEFFEPAFGVIKEDNPQTVTLKAYGIEQQYLKALPLHHSQEEIERGDGYAIFRYYLCTTYDFKQELLSKGAAIEVLTPAALRHEIHDMITAMHNRYEE